MLELIQRRPVRFAFLVEAFLGALIVFGVPLTTAQLGALMLLVNAGLAFAIESYTTPIRRDGTPMNPAYKLEDN